MPGPETAYDRHAGPICNSLTDLHRGDFSGCTESENQGSPVEKSSRMSLHYIMQNNGAHDLVLPLPNPSAH